LDGNLSLNAAGIVAGAAFQVNATIEPFMWLELRGIITWVLGVNNNPVVRLVAEIAGEQSLEARRDPSGVATTAVI